MCVLLPVVKEGATHNPKVEHDVELVEQLEEAPSDRIDRKRGHRKYASEQTESTGKARRQQRVRVRAVGKCRPDQCAGKNVGVP